MLNLQTGILKKCYRDTCGQNIFEDIDKKIDFSPVGNNCDSLFCANSSHFMSLGVIPEIDTPSYASLRNRPEANWYSDEMREFLDCKLYESNKQYGERQKKRINKRILEQSIKDSYTFKERVARRFPFVYKVVSSNARKNENKVI